MADPYKKMVDTFKDVFGGNDNIPLIIAQVKEITGESCTVLYDTDEMELTDVRLKATINGDGNYILQIPKVGSSVVCGSISGDLTDLCVLKADEVEQLQYVQGGLKILVDSTDGKVSVQSGSVSLAGLMQSMADILKSLKVYTNVGPSGTPLPDSITKIEQFEKDFKTLLK